MKDFIKPEDENELYYEATRCYLTIPGFRIFITRPRIGYSLRLDHVSGISNAMDFTGDDNIIWRNKPTLNENILDTYIVDSPINFLCKDYANKRSFPEYMKISKSNALNIILNVPANAFEFSFYHEDLNPHIRTNDQPIDYYAFITEENCAFFPYPAVETYVKYLKNFTHIEFKYSPEEEFHIRDIESETDAYTMHKFFAHRFTEINESYQTPIFVDDYKLGCHPSYKDNNIIYLFVANGSVLYNNNTYEVCDIFQYESNRSINIKSLEENSVIVGIVPINNGKILNELGEPDLSRIKLR